MSGRTGWRGLARAVAIVAVLAVPSGASGATAVSAGKQLRAKVTANPWSLTLTGPRGHLVLAERAATGSGPAGTIGFRSAGQWQHATSVVSATRNGGGYQATLATTDALHTIALELRRAADGVIALKAQVVGPPGFDAVGIGFDTRSPSERFLGFGERSNTLDQRGNVVEDYVADGPYQTEEYPFVSGFVPVWGLRERADSTYYPVPWLLSTAGYGVLIGNPQTSYFRLDGSDSWSAEVVREPEGEAGGELGPQPDTLRMRFFAGPKPAQALRRFTRATGRQPRAAAPWQLGTWFQAGSDEQAALQAMRDADVPISVLQTYLHYLPCGAQQGVEAAQPPRTAAAHAAGVAITTYFNPMVCATYTAAYNQAQSDGALMRMLVGGLPYVFHYGASLDDVFAVSQFDFFKAAGRSAYAALLGEAIGDGYDGWMEDFGEYTPLDSLAGEASAEIDGTRSHNPYPRRYHCAAYDAARKRARAIVRYQRSGWTGAARCAQVVWGGDPTTAFGFDGLASAVRQALSAGASGIGIWGSDIGGFFALGTNELTPELLTRWVQLGAVSPVMRTERSGVAVPPRERPQVNDADQLANWRRYSKLHTQLYPYLLAAQRTYRRTGMPLMRALALVHPRDPAGAGLDDEFLLGRDLLAAPVVEEGATDRSVYLPRGRWLDLWRSARYAKRSGAIHLNGRRVLRGKRGVTLPAPIDQLPLLVRAGAVVPMLPPAVDTLARYGKDTPGIVRLADRRHRLDLLAFPARRRSTSRLGARGRAVSIARHRSWELRIRDAGRKSYRLQASLAALRPGFRVCRVSLGSRRLRRSRWSYSRTARVLRARFSGRHPTLRVRGC